MSAAVYPHQPGFKRRQTSRAAAEAIAPSAGSIRARALWADRWGAALCDRCLETEGQVADGNVVDDLESDLRSAEDRSANLTRAINHAAREIDRFLEREDGSLAAKHFADISKIGDDLEGAL